MSEPTKPYRQTLWGKASVWVGNHLVWILLIILLAGIYVALTPSPWE